MLEWLKDKFHQKQPNAEFSLVPIPSKEPRIHKIEYHGQAYEFESPDTEQEVREWFDQYASTAPSCTSCSQLLFPYEPVAKNGDELMHLTRQCCPAGMLFSGHINEHGQLEVAFKDAENLAQSAIKQVTNEIQDFI